MSGGVNWKLQGRDEWRGEQGRDECRSWKLQDRES